MAAAIVHSMEYGSRSSTGDWAPFAWTEPVRGPQVCGEVLVIRTGGTSGSLSAGLWRSGKGLAGCRDDGTSRANYSAPLGDETVVILEGTVEITVTSSGKKYQLQAGSTMSHPKNLDIVWDITSPFLKKFWVIFDSPKPATKSDDLFVGDISDNPAIWTPYTWDEPGEGPQVCGELFTLRSTGSTGTLMCGLWRTGVGIAGCAADGSSSVPYSAVLGDETMLLLEGQAKVMVHDTGKEYLFKAGDVIALPSGLRITWTSLGPFVKKFWVITNAGLPTA